MAIDPKVANREFYDSARPSERERFGSSPSKLHTAEIIVPWVTANVGAGTLVLDIAGGAGTYASAISEASGAAFVGLDISSEMVQQRTRYPSLALNVVGDMEALPFEGNSFDAVTLIACLHHLPDPAESIREAYRVLRPGGRAFVFEPSSLKARRGSQQTHLPHEFRLSVGWLAHLFLEAGFRIEGLETRRIAVRLLTQLKRQPSVRAFHVGDAIDRALRILPGLRLAGSAGLIQARKDVG